MPVDSSVYSYGNLDTKPVLQEALGKSDPSSDTALLSVKMSDSQNWPQVALMLLFNVLPKQLCQTDEHVQK